VRAGRGRLDVCHGQQKADVTDVGARLTVPPIWRSASPTGSVLYFSPIDEHQHPLRPCAAEAFLRSRSLGVGSGVGASYGDEEKLKV